MCNPFHFHHRCRFLWPFFSPNTWGDSPICSGHFKYKDISLYLSFSEYFMIFCDSSKCDINLDFMPSYGSIISYHLHSPYFAYPFVCWWTFWLLSFSDCKWHFYEHLYVELGAYVFTLPGWMTRKAITGTFMWSFRRNCHIVFQSGFIILHSSSNFWGFWFLRSSLTSVTVM